MVEYVIISGTIGILLAIRACILVWQQPEPDTGVLGFQVRRHRHQQRIDDELQEMIRRAP